MRLLTVFVLGFVLCASSFADIKEEIRHLQDKVISESAALDHLSNQISEMKEVINNARSTRNLGVYIFIPSALVTAVGGMILSGTRNLGGGEFSGMLELMGQLVGVPLISVGGISTLVSGYKVFAKQYELSDLWEDLVVLEGEINEKRRELDEDRRTLFGKKRELCVLEGGNPTDCEREYEDSLQTITIARL